MTDDKNPYSSVHVLVVDDDQSMITLIVTIPRCRAYSWYVPGSLTATFNKYVPENKTPPSWRGPD